MSFNQALCNLTLAHFMAIPALVVGGSCRCGQPIHIHPGVTSEAAGNPSCEETKPKSVATTNRSSRSYDSSIPHSNIDRPETDVRLARKTKLKSGASAKLSSESVDRGKNYVGSHQKDQGTEFPGADPFAKSHEKSPVPQGAVRTGGATEIVGVVSGAIAGIVAGVQAIGFGGAIPNNSKPHYCHNFAKGYCKYGSNCKYAHSREAKAAASMDTMKQALQQKDRALKEHQLKIRELEFNNICNSMEHQILAMSAKMKDLLKAANSLDLVLVMDCTGSMSKWIASAKAQLCAMVDGIRSVPGNRDLKIRLGFVAYRDHSDGDDRVVATPLSTDIAAVKEVINQQRAFGGDDGPEDVVGGLKASLEMDWKAGARLIVLICDAPCHFNRYHNSVDSEKHLKDALALYGSETYIETLAQNMAQAGIDFVTIEILHKSTKKMTDLLKTVYENAPTPLDGIARKFSVMPMANGHEDAIKLGELVTEVGRSSVSESKMRTERSISSLASSSSLGGTDTSRKSGKVGKSSKATPKLASVVEDEGSESEHAVPDVFLTAPSLTKATVDWDRVMALTPQRAKRYSYIYRPSDNTDWSNPPLRLVSQVTDVNFDESFFSEGAMRTAHLMHDSTLNARLAAKVYKRRNVDSTKWLATIQQDVQAQAIAKALANEFSLRAEVPQAVDFIVTSYYELLDRDDSDPFKYISAEPFIAGDYRKYNNNNGWASAEFSETAQAFSHFTWHHTSASLMVVDLQGVNFILTDPQIHTSNHTEKRFGLGNLGIDGMVRFFCTHRCNSICKGLNLRGFSSKRSAKSGSGAKAGGSSTAERSPSSTAAVEASETAISSATVMDETVANKQLSLSCMLCGSIFDCCRKALMDAAAIKRQVYCSGCTTKMQTKTTATCTEGPCKETFDYSDYWYKMIGMEPRKICHSCKLKKQNASKKSP